MFVCSYSPQLFFNGFISAMNYSLFFPAAQPLQLFHHAFDTMWKDVQQVHPKNTLHCRKVRALPSRGSPWLHEGIGYKL